MPVPILRACFIWVVSFYSYYYPRGRSFYYPHYTDEKTELREVKELTKGYAQLVTGGAGLGTQPSWPWTACPGPLPSLAMQV